MKTVILAGGNGTRMGSITNNNPKPMLKIGNKPIIWHIMKIYSGYGIKDFIICTGYKYRKINKYFIKTCGDRSEVKQFTQEKVIKINNYNNEGWNISLVYTGDKTKTGGRIKRIKKYINDETFCLTYCDGVSDIDINTLIEFHKEQGALATVTAVHPPEKFGIIKFNGDKTKVHNFLEKPVRSDWINGGFFVLNPEIFKYLDGDDCVWEKEPLSKLANMNQLSAYKHRGYWECMDTVKDQKNLNNSWLEGEAKWKTW